MIREAVKEDISNLNQIGEQYNSNFASLFHLESEIEKDFSIILVYEKDNNILGFLYALDFQDNLDLLYIIVNEENRHQHIATKIMEYFVNNYQVNNKTITLEVAVDNEKARRLYGKFNFYEVNRRKGYYHGVDALLMRRD